jgi:ABC-type Fe3+ transport system permease subunit
VPAILPGIIFGVGYIVAFNVPFGFKSLSLTGSSAILVLNILFSNLFVGVLAAAPPCSASTRRWTRQRRASARASCNALCW